MSSVWLHDIEERAPYLHIIQGFTGMLWGLPEWDLVFGSKASLNRSSGVVAFFLALLILTSGVLAWLVLRLF